MYISTTKHQMSAEIFVVVVDFEKRRGQAVSSFFKL